MVFRNVHITRGGAWPWGDSRELRTGDLVSRDRTRPPAPATSTRSTARPRTCSAREPVHRRWCFLGGMGSTTTTWADLRAALGPDVRTCAWDYPGVGHSTGAPMMTAARAASSLHGTLRAAARAAAGDPGRPQHRRPHHPPLRRRAPSRCRRRRALRPHGRLVRPHVRRQGVPARLGRDEPVPARWSRSPPGRTSPSRSSATTPPSTPPARSGATPSRPNGVPTRPRSPRSPHGTARVVPGSGHNVYQDAPERVGRCRPAGAGRSGRTPVTPGAPEQPRSDEDDRREP